MRLGLDRLWLVVAIALPAFVALLVPLPAVDLAYQVRAGDEILATGAIPSVDTWTFSVAGTQWVDQQWLAQVALAAGHKAAGWELLAVVRAALVAGALGLLVAAAMARGAPPRAAAILGLVAFALAAPALALRPQLFGIAIFAGLLWIVATRRDHPRRLWVAPLLVVVWANVHGSFVLAPLLLGYAWLDDVVRGHAWRASLVVLVLGVVATLVNPFGPGAWAYAAGIGANPVITARVSEWQRTSPLSVLGLLFYASAVAGLLVLVRGRAALRWPDWLWFAGMLAIGAWTVRGLAWVPFGLVFVVAAALPAAFPALATPSRERPRSPIAGVVALLFVVLIVVALPWWRPADPLTGRVGLLTYAPSGLAQALRDRAPTDARVFAPQTWASWFEWAAPNALQFLDSRFELYPADVWADYEAIAAGGDGAAEALDRWAVDLLVVPAGGTQPATGWTVVYEDDDGSILVPEGP